MTYVTFSLVAGSISPTFSRGGRISRTFSRDGIIFTDHLHIKLKLVGLNIELLYTPYIIDNEKH